MCPSNPDHRSWRGGGAFLVWPSEPRALSPGSGEGALSHKEAPFFSQGFLYLTSTLSPEDGWLDGCG